MAFLQSEPRTRIILSAPEMLAISQIISREFSPCFTKRDAVSARTMTFTAQELLSISREVSREFAPRSAENRSNLVLLPVDAHRLHAYWHLAENRPNAATKPAAEEKLILRIYKDPSAQLETADGVEEPLWFDIAIGSGESRREVILPADTDTVFANTSSTYSAAIGAIGDHGFTAVVCSNNAEIPKPRPRWDNSRLSAAVSRFIMPRMNDSSPAGKKVSHQEI